MLKYEYSSEKHRACLAKSFRNLQQLFSLSIATDDVHEAAETAHFIFRREMKKKEQHNT